MSFAGKPELWSAHEVEVFDQTFCSDGFCLNLCTVLLFFSRPFTEPDSNKLAAIKPRYCRVVPKTEEEEKKYCVHARGKHKTFFTFPYLSSNFTCINRIFYSLKALSEWNTRELRKYIRYQYPS